MSVPKTGDRISNYILEAPVGEGSFGQVWRARHHMFDERVAIKIPTDTQYVRNLQREGVAVHGLRHPNIVRAIDLDPYADPPYFIMEYVAGPSLRAVIDGWKNGLPLDSALAVMGGVLKALSAAHDAGVIHRDIKPANILLTCSADEVDEITDDMVRVTDFGLGRVGGMTTTSMMQSGSMLTAEGKNISGTMAYMSPEQKEGHDGDARSDLYSCGIVLYEMLTGSRPQGADPPSSLREDLPPYLDDVFRRCYTRHERRFSSAQQMLDTLSAGLSVAPLRATSIGIRGSARCGGCGQPANSDDQFCISCGHQLVEVVPRCPSCEAYVNRADRFCIFCGTDLRVKTA
ncbi:MAG: protein kinase [Planctomycetes bacterium]|nr:protein kinase [Planctomycetota bacterium]